MAGKGSRRRLQSISIQEMTDNWDRIFGNNNSQSKPARYITAATEQFEIAQKMTKGSKIPVNLSDLTCKYYDSGWCYHPNSDAVHGCPGLGNCDIIIEIID